MILAAEMIGLAGKGIRISDQLLKMEEALSGVRAIGVKDRYVRTFHGILIGTGEFQTGFESAPLFPVAKAFGRKPREAGRTLHSDAQRDGAAETPAAFQRTEKKGIVQAG